MNLIWPSSVALIFPVTSKIQSAQAMRIHCLLVVFFFAMLLVSPASGERVPRFVSHCLRRGGICRYDDCSEGEEQIGTCYHHTMICCRDEVTNLLTRSEPMNTFLLILLVCIELPVPGNLQDQKPKCDPPHHSCSLGKCSEGETLTGRYCFYPVIYCCKSSKIQEP
ncbi:UNVERIFIED_CONTAM: hypothetical protein K2H54_036410 [Gekko kuhli]